MTIDPSHIAIARADIARRRAELDAEERDLDAVERFAARYGNGWTPAEPVPRVGRKRSVDGVTPQQAQMLETIDNQGGAISRSFLQEALNITPASLATLLSRSRENLIETEGNIVRRKSVSEGGADVS